MGDFWQGVVATLREELFWEGVGDCTKIIHAASSPRECAEYLQLSLNRKL